MNEVPKAQIPEPTPTGVFLSTLTSMHQGKILTDLDEAMREVTACVGHANKKGKVTLTLTISPNGVGVGETPLFKVEDEVKMTKPKRKREGQSFFADENSNLSRRNPNQEEMKLRSVPEMGESGKIIRPPLSAAN